LVLLSGNLYLILIYNFRQGAKLLEEHKMKKAVSRLFQLRKALDECEKEFGLGEFSEVERAVFSFITSNSNVTITAIKNDPYFSKYSLSTIKRAVLFLTSNGIVSAHQSSTDKREMILKFDQ